MSLSWLATVRGRHGEGARRVADSSAGVTVAEDGL